MAEHAPGGRMAFMHPVKSRAAIACAYSDHAVRTFAFDTLEELEKIQDATGRAKDLNLLVRLGVEASGAAYSLSGKFGVDAREAPPLLLAARRATDELMGVSFHVGSQCMRPSAFPAAMAQASAPWSAPACSPTWSTWAAASRRPIRAWFRRTSTNTSPPSTGASPR